MKSDLYFYIVGCVVGSLSMSFFKNDEIKFIEIQKNKFKKENYILKNKINHLTNEIKMLNDEINNLKK
jgi:tRNA1(Val) A37 N6-methylase TrmN6